MKIVNKKEFYELPNGTLYSHYDPCVFSGLMIKGDTIRKRLSESPFDFYYEDLIGNVEYDDSGEFVDTITEAKENKTVFALDFECVQRDGLYEDNALYAVYSSEEVALLSNKIQNCVGVD